MVWSSLVERLWGSVLYRILCELVLLTVILLVTSWSMFRADMQCLSVCVYDYLLMLSFWREGLLNLLMVMAVNDYGLSKWSGLAVKDTRTANDQTEFILAVAQALRQQDPICIYYCYCYYC